VVQVRTSGANESSRVQSPLVQVDHQKYGIPSE
jgi:hypothetical protein